MKRKLCIASSNQWKIFELTPILGEVFEIYSLNDLGVIAESEEPFLTYEENAQFKAKYYAKFTQMLTLSEDAGLQIHALNDFPGVYSKRFIAKGGGLLHAYKQIKDMLALKLDHTAKFVCASTIYDIGTGKIFSGIGILEGEIRFPPKGTHGFGFDAIFVPDGYDQTIAELGPEIKSAIGHRGKSIRNLLKNYTNPIPK